MGHQTEQPEMNVLTSHAYTKTSTTPDALVHLTATFRNTGQAQYNVITISSPSAGTVDDAIPFGNQTASSVTSRSARPSP